MNKTFIVQPGMYTTASPVPGGQIERQLSNGTQFIYNDTAPITTNDISYYPIFMDGIRFWIPVNPYDIATIQLTVEQQRTSIYTRITDIHTTLNTLSNELKQLTDQLIELDTI